jgi:NADH:ubiquinone oxidoreductase subunit 6 (subunit J)
VADEKPRKTGWQETKTDFKWGIPLLFVLMLAISAVGAPYVGGGWAPWDKVPAAEEDLNAMTDAIFDPHQSLLVPFEVLSVLLLAALVAGVVVALREGEVD